MDTSIFAQAIEQAKQARNITIECEVPTEMAINTKCLEQGYYHFANIHGVKGEIIEYIGFDVFTDIQYSVFTVQTLSGSYKDFDTYKDAKSYAATLKEG